MPMNNGTDACIFRGRLADPPLAVTAAVTTALVNEAVQLQDCDPAAAHLLARGVTTGVLAASLLEPGDRVNLAWRYSGVLRTVVVDAGRDGTARGMIGPSQLGATAENSDQLYGEKGKIQVIRMRQGKVLSSGIAETRLQELVADYGHYVSVSDQTETGVVAMVGFRPDPTRPVALARGVLVQALPGCDLARFDRVRSRMGDAAFRDPLADPACDDVRRWIAPLMDDAAQLAALALEEGDAPRFSCTCTREKMDDVARALPIPERMRMVRSKEPLAVTCQFCRKRYELSVEECIKAWNRGRNADPGTRNC